MKIIDCRPDSPVIDQMHSSTRQEICNRHVLAFGEGIQQRISELTIGVITVGGLGSVIIEQLMRLFPRKLVYVDKDVVELSNLNRLVGATMIDSRIGTRKVDLVTRNVLEFNADQEVQAIHGDFLDKNSQEKFRQCDFVFGGSDSNAVRIATNRLCLAHGIPYLDCGVGAVVEQGQLQAAGGQIIRILPDSGFCLHCSGLFNVENAMQEFLSEDERERQDDQGYIRGTDITAPQVYSLNMMTASWAVWVFIRMVSGEKLGFDGIAIDAKGFKTYTWKESSEKTNDCPTCGRNGIVFGGDDVDLLGKDELESDVAGMETENSSTTDSSQKVEVRIDREIPIPQLPGMIIGENIGSPFCSGICGLM